MIVPVALGATAGLGLWCLLRAFLPAPPPLDDALAALSVPRRPSAPARPGAGSLTGPARAWFGSVLGTASSTGLGSLAADLAVLDRSEEVHVVQRLRTAAFYGCLPPAVWLATSTAGSAIAATGHIALATAGLAAGGWLLTDTQVRSAAGRRRSEAEAVVVTYTQLVSVLLAGGAGTHQALHEAAEHGRGWAFQLLRQALSDARIRGITPWQAFDEHGRRLDLDCLVELAVTMDLAGSSGAVVRETLAAKAQALRSRHVAAVERSAATRTTAMTGPTGLMMIGFVILVVYPAFQAVLDL